MSVSLGIDVSTRHVLVAQRLRQRRDELGLTQKQIVTRLARCGLRTTNRALSSLEHGSGLDVAKLPELAEALDCTVTYLIGLTDDPHDWCPAAPPAPPAPSAAGGPAAADDRRERRSPPILGEFIPERRTRRRTR